jgi:hypothetical protein
MVQEGASGHKSGTMGTLRHAAEGRRARQSARPWRLASRFERARSYPEAARKTAQNNRTFSGTGVPGNRPSGPVRLVPSADFETVAVFPRTGSGSPQKAVLAGPGGTDPLGTSRLAPGFPWAGPGVRMNLSSPGSRAGLGFSGRPLAIRYRCLGSGANAGGRGVGTCL